MKTEKEEGNYAQISVSPLVAGYGNTLGTALRRVLLSSLPGAAITRVKISGVKHQFSTLKGMKEDVLDFLLNLKRVRFEYDGKEPVKATLSVSNEGVVTAGQIETPANVRVANPDYVLANLSKGAKLEAELWVESGIGYSPVEERSREQIGTIPLDANFSPVERVNIKIEETRVGRITNYDKLVMEIWTDGSTKPLEAIRAAAAILVSYFTQVVSPQEVVKEVAQEEPRESLGTVGRLSVEEIGLPTRVANALSKAGYDTVEKLVNADRNDLVKVRNLGEKSVKIISDTLKEKGVEFPNA